MIAAKPRTRGGEEVRRNVLETVGRTPIIQLERYLDSSSIELFAKWEAANPGGSAKDRPAKKMVEAALQSGELTKDSVVVESSSGNMGIGLAQVCRYYGLRFICVVDARTQIQNIKMMQAYGAHVEIIRTPDPLTGEFLTARINRVRELVSTIDSAFWPNQYANEENPRSHEEGTIAEIDAALDGDFDYLFVATSSTGTARGCRDYLRARGRRAKVIAVDAEGSVLFGGQRGARRIPGLGAGRVSRLARGQQFDRTERVSDLDCVVGCRRLMEREALMAGGSSGGVLEALRRSQNEFDGARCVAILADSGTRYLDTVFNDMWVEQQLRRSPQELQRLVNSTEEPATV